MKKTLQVLGIIAVAAMMVLGFTACFEDGGHNSHLPDLPTVPNVSTPANITATFGQFLFQITLPSGWAWDNPNTQVGAVGQQTHSATYTRWGNYLPVTRNITVTVSEAPPTIPNVTTPADITATFGQTLSEIDLPPGWAWDSPNMQVGEVGRRTHSATYTRMGNYLPVTRNITVNVSEAPPTIPNVTTPANITATFGQTLSEIDLPLGWEWDSPNMQVGEVGQRTHSATYTRTGNYLPVTRDITVTVSEAPPTIPNVTTPADITATFGQTLSEIDLPSGWAWDSPNIQVGAVGQQTHSATYTRTGNYLPVTRDITVTVERAIPDYTVPAARPATLGDTLSQVTLPQGWTWDNPTALVGSAGIQTHNATFTPADTDNYLTVTRAVTVTVADLRDFSISFADFQDGAPPEITVPSFSLGGAPQVVNVQNPAVFSRIEWFVDGDRISQGASLTLGRNVHGNRTGTHFVTIEVTRGGSLYSRVITFTVTP